MNSKKTMTTRMSNPPFPLLTPPTPNTTNTLIFPLHYISFRMLFYNRTARVSKRNSDKSKKKNLHRVVITFHCRNSILFRIGD